MPKLSRRQVLAGTAAIGLLPRVGNAALPTPFVLRAAPATQGILGGNRTDVWAFNGIAPGPVLRTRQGQPFAASFANNLAHSSTVHWHGIRLVNAMDGVGGMTQAPVPAGGAFDYAFTPPDAGTYWYHPHEMSYEQVPRGLFGALIVEEPNPPQVDQDLVLVINDWRLSADGVMAGSFGSRHDQAHAGRLGNVITVNGEINPVIPVKRFERVRLRLINCSTARILELRLDGTQPKLIAYDGQPLAPTSGGYGAALLLGPGNRADLILDLTGERGASQALVDMRGGEPRVLARLVLDSAEQARDGALAAPIQLAANPVPMPGIDKATSHELLMTGGAADERDMSALMGTGPIWNFNGKPGMMHHGGAMVSDHPPLFRATRAETIALTLENRTAWPHAMHLHGHHFRLVRRADGKPPQPWWWDTYLMEPGETATIAFVADNPGRWMIHCHMLDHQAAGMATWFEVA